MRRLLPLLLLFLVSACKSSAGGAEGPIERETATIHIEAARGEIEDGRDERAMRRLIELRQLAGLTPDQRLAVEELLDESSRNVLGGLLAEGAGSDELFDLYQEDLAPRLKARAGVAAAALLLREGSPVRAFKQIKRVERDLPSHVERKRAGDVVAELGLDLIRRRGRYLLFFRYASRGQEALEFLVLHYPFHPACPAAYAELVEHYSARGKHDLAIERAEDLVIYHAEDPRAVAMQWRLPALRLARLERDDYDRAELLQARGELELWLTRHGGRAEHEELQERVEETLRHCQARLARNDLIVAHFYDTVDEPQGVRLHAERALVAARAATDAGAVAEAEELLARHADASAPAGETVP